MNFGAKELFGGINDFAEAASAEIVKRATKPKKPANDNTGSTGTSPKGAWLQNVKERAKDSTSAIYKPVDGKPKLTIIDPRDWEGKPVPESPAVLIMAIGYQIAVDREPGFRVQPSG